MRSCKLRSKVKVTGGGGILWRPPTQLVILLIDCCHFGSSVSIQRWVVARYCWWMKAAHSETWRHVGRYLCYFEWRRIIAGQFSRFRPCLSPMLLTYGRYALAAIASAGTTLLVVRWRQAARSIARRSLMFSDPVHVVRTLSRYTAGDFSWCLGCHSSGAAN